MGLNHLGSEKSLRAIRIERVACIVGVCVITVVDVSGER